MKVSKPRAWLISLALSFVVAACGSGASSAARTADGRLQVVVAENSWGSIAAQLGGDRAEVTSIVTSPDTDPHDFEPTPRDARAIASAQYVVFNGLGYDAWAEQVVDANPDSSRTVLDVGKLLQLDDGDNPHRWYFPADVDKVIDQITADFKKLSPGDAAYFDQQREYFETTALKAYKDLLATIRRGYAGTPVGASENVFAGLADATGLDLVTPPAFLRAVSEGTDPTARDKTTVDQQISRKLIKVFVYNSQNSTPDVVALVSAARSAGLAVASITETPPENVSFQDWQSQQLQQLADALARSAAP